MENTQQNIEVLQEKSLLVDKLMKYRENVYKVFFYMSIPYAITLIFLLLNKIFTFSDVSAAVFMLYILAPIGFIAQIAIILFIVYIIQYYVLKRKLIKNGLREEIRKREEENKLLSYRIFSFVIIIIFAIFFAYTKLH